MRHVLILTVVLILLLGAGAPALADDSDIFMVDVVEPNVVILIDSSGSMNGQVDSVGTMVGDGGDAMAVTAKKIDVAKQVVGDLIANVEGVRIAIFRFNGDSSGGMLVAPVGEEQTTMIEQVNSISPIGETPLGRAAQTVQDYYLGLLTGRTCIGECDGVYDPPGGIAVGFALGGDDASDEGSDDGGEIWSEEITWPSPIEYECQKSYAILVTDGMPSGEATDLVTDVAQSLYETDHSALPGTQNVIVHTVGFDVEAGTQLLTDTAEAAGGTFYTATSADELEQAIQNALSSILEDTYTFSAPMVPSTSAAGGTRGFVASFEPDPIRPFWNGHLRAYTLNANGRIPLDAEGEPDADALIWDAGSLLASHDPSTRLIYTAVGGTRTPFANSGSTVGATTLGVDTDAEKVELINFVRGVDSHDEDLDGNTTEQRPWKLGAIFHSDPVLVFPPPLHNTDPAYKTFKTTHRNRTTVVLVGADDGMLHAFRASDGAELWGFIPPDLLGGLDDMAQRIGDHAYYVDSSPVVADVKTKGSWKTIAVFGLRRGGHSYHALDITDTTNPLYLWSFSDAELGESWSEPAIGKILMSDDTDRYVAFVGGGYNTTANNASGRGVFAIDLATGAKLFEYKTGGAGDKAQMNFSIPASPGIVDLDQNGYVDFVYVGDVGGQLWKFDVSAPASLSGGLIDNWTGKLLFTALPGQTNPPIAGEYRAPQAFYGTPTLAYDESDDLWVFAGTGDLNHPKDTSGNYFFGIKDDTSMTNGSALTAASLVNVNSDNAITQGWYRVLASNEKALGSADVFDNMVLFTTHVPNLTDPCVAALGGSRLYAIRLEDGLPAIDWATGEKLADPDTSDDPSQDGGDGIASDPVVLLGSTTDSIVTTSSDGEMTEVEIPTSRSKVLRYWREVTDTTGAQNTEGVGTGDEAQAP